MDHQSCIERSAIIHFRLGDQGKGNFVNRKQSICFARSVEKEAINLSSDFRELQGKTFPHPYDKHFPWRKSFSQPCDSHLLSAAYSWGVVNKTTFAEGLMDQHLFEVFYRLQLSCRLAITPNVQFIIIPALSNQKSSIFVWEIRRRIAL